MILLLLSIVDFEIFCKGDGFMKRIPIFLIFLILIFTAQKAFAISKEDIVVLSGAGVEDKVIMTYIENQCCSLPSLNEEDMEGMREAGLSENLLSFLEDFQRNNEKYCIHVKEHLKIETLLFLREHNYRSQNRNKVDRKTNRH